MAASDTAEGVNALVDASTRGNIRDVRKLLDQGVQVDCRRDTDGLTPLCGAAYYGRLKMCRELLSRGASIDFPQREGCTADVLADRYGHRRLAEWLRKEQLFQIGTMKPNTIVLRLGGPPGSGKSTVADSFATGMIRGFFRWESQADEGDENPHQRTRGIRLVNFKSRDSINGVIIDLGGQGLYFMTHQALISVDGAPVINAIVVSSLRELEQLQLDVSQWAGFFACRVQPSSSLQPLLMFATRADRATLQQKTAVVSVFENIKTAYSRYFKFPCQPFFMDARKSRSLELVQLRSKIHNLQQEVLNAAALQPSVCEFLQEVLPAIKTLTAKPLIKKTEFLEHMSTVLHQRKMQWRGYSADVISASLKMSVLDTSLQHLTKQGKVVAFKKIALRDFVVIKPEWIYTGLVGLIMSDHPLPKPYVKYQNGYAKLSEVIDLLKTAHPDVSGEEALEMLSELGFVIVFEDKALVPVKLQERRPEKHWKKIPRVMIVEWVFAGRRYRFVGIVGPSSALFPLTQSHFYHLFKEKDDTELPLWAGGIRISSELYQGAEAIIESRPKLCCIDVIVRGRVSFALECHRLLHNACDEVTALVAEHSPGCTVERLILSSAELSDLSVTGSLSAPAVAYTEARLHRALENGTHVTDGKGSTSEDTGSLMLSDEELQQFGPAMSEESLGKVLDAADTELYDIALQLAFDMAGLMRFASFLLSGSGCKLTGEQLFANLDPHEFTTIPSKAHALLQYWINGAPQPSYARRGGQLKNALQRAGKGTVAATFNSYFMGK